MRVLCACCIVCVSVPSKIEVRCRSLVVEEGRDGNATRVRAGRLRAAHCRRVVDEERSQSGMRVEAVDVDVDAGRGNEKEECLGRRPRSFGVRRA